MTHIIKLADPQGDVYYYGHGKWGNDKTKAAELSLPEAKQELSDYLDSYAERKGVVALGLIKNKISIAPV